MPGKAFGLPNKLLQIHNKAKAMLNIRKTRLYSQGCGHSFDTSYEDGVVLCVPQMKMSSASSTVCFLNTSANSTFQFKSAGLSLPT